MDCSGLKRVRKAIDYLGQPHPPRSIEIGYKTLNTHETYDTAQDTCFVTTLRRLNLLWIENQPSIWLPIIIIEKYSRLKRWKGQRPYSNAFLIVFISTLIFCLVNHIHVLKKNDKSYLPYIVFFFRSLLAFEFFFFQMKDFVICSFWYLVYF